MAKACRILTPSSHFDRYYDLDVLHPGKTGVLIMFNSIAFSLTIKNIFYSNFSAPYGSSSTTIHGVAV